MGVRDGGCQVHEELQDTAKWWVDRHGQQSLGAMGCGNGGGQQQQHEHAPIRGKQGASEQVRVRQTSKRSKDVLGFSAYATPQCGPHSTEPSAVQQHSTGKAAASCGALPTFTNGAE